MVKALQTGEIDAILKSHSKWTAGNCNYEHVPHKDNLDLRRIQWEEFLNYDHALNQAIECYAGRIHVIKGFECEYYPEELEAYRMFREKYGYQLLILGQHRSGENREIDNFAEKGVYEMEVYANEICRRIETGIV